MAEWRRLEWWRSALVAVVILLEGGDETGVSHAGCLSIRGELGRRGCGPSAAVPVWARPNGTGTFERSECVRCGACVRACVCACARAFVCALRAAANARVPQRRLSAERHSSSNRNSRSRARGTTSTTSAEREASTSRTGESPGLREAGQRGGQGRAGNRPGSRQGQLLVISSSRPNSSRHARTKQLTHTSVLLLLRLRLRPAERVPSKSFSGVKQDDK
ncbi:hypothetical protein DFH27DRAFT_68317 [Peziza echinospora]|nr:hypothetical protein DFH27DRAFT_68317 [Peziza echinospora]